MSKERLRKQISILVKSLSPLEKKRQSSNVFKKLVKHPNFQKASRLFLYLSTENEVDTQPILRHAFEFEKLCYIPFVDKSRMLRSPHDKTRMVMMRLESMEKYESLELNHYGIKEPKEGPKKAEDAALPLDETTSIGTDFDLFVVPGVAFGQDGMRLGHGKGYYDEFLDYWSKSAKPGSFYAIGIGFKEQIVANPLAVEGHDFRLDEIIFPD